MSELILQELARKSGTGEKVLAVLIDPEKWNDAHLDALFASHIHAKFHWVLVGGSTAQDGQTHECIDALRRRTEKPVILFPGGMNQVDPSADALLLLSLMNSEDREFIIGKHIRSAKMLAQSALEIIPTAYILVGDDLSTTVAKVSKSLPISENNPELILSTALAAEQMGKKVVYLESGSGAVGALDPKIVSDVRELINIPLILGGGVRSHNDVVKYWNAGADVVVVGTAIENDLAEFFA